MPSARHATPSTLARPPVQPRVSMARAARARSIPCGGSRVGRVVVLNERVLGAMPTGDGGCATTSVGLSAAGSGLDSCSSVVSGRANLAEASSTHNAKPVSSGSTTRVTAIILSAGCQRRLLCLADAARWWRSSFRRSDSWGCHVAPGSEPLTDFAQERPTPSHGVHRLKADNIDYDSGQRSSPPPAN